MTLPNPFEVLRLDPSATDEEIVRQAGRLRQRSVDEETLAAVRQAVQALTGNAEERQLASLLTHPGPDYAVGAVDRFAANFRRPPSSDPGSVAMPTVTLDQCRNLFQAILAKTLDLPVELLAEPLSAELEEALFRKDADAAWKALIAMQETEPEA